VDIPFPGFMSAFLNLSSREGDPGSGTVLTFTTFFGPQVHHLLSGMGSRTAGICWPQPDQVVLLHVGQVRSKHIAVVLTDILVLLGGIDKVYVIFLIEIDLKLLQRTVSILAEDEDTIVTTKQKGRAWNRNAIHN
jgi:hypothetical protein